MGCAASATDDRAEQRRRRGRGRGRGRAAGHNSETSTTGVLVTRHQNDGQPEPTSAAVAAARRRGCKVAPEPKEEDGAAAAFLLAMPGSPSFRLYCQKSSAVDALVADADGGDSDARTTKETPQPIKNDGRAVVVPGSVELSKPEASRWLRFRCLVAAAVCSLFSRHGTAASASSHPPPAAKSHHR
ncbi:uncharacterized protein LOC102715724 [Oryza brachyantha]|uniref:uncharacterized protein LOC102715724 n=1 Tax=Oryza brachyantha TaxID=4533 RepID=UPI001AD9F12B|nr:uncharacterized protein LOC102715724 [Oryza brachyantha]